MRRHADIVIEGKVELIHGEFAAGIDRLTGWFSTSLVRRPFHRGTHDLHFLGLDWFLLCHVSRIKTHVSPSTCPGALPLQGSAWRIVEANRRLDPLLWLTGNVILGEPMKVPPV
jgi:hypothetical protein